MDVAEAVAQRTSVRAFLPTPVPGELIRRVLTTAARAPSGGNLQPWHVDIVAELQKLAALKDAGVLSDAEFAAAKAKLLG